MKARLVVGMRVSSVFTPPTRPALAAKTYEEAKRIFETHPEVAFAALFGPPWLSSKKTPAGRDERLRLLGTVLNDVERFGRRRQRHLHVDDILDATMAAVIAARRHFGRAQRLPDDPPRDSRGLRMEIWY